MDPEGILLLEFIEKAIVGTGALGDVGITTDHDPELVFRHRYRRGVNRHGVDVMIHVAGIEKFDLARTCSEALTLMQPVAWADDIVDTLLFKGCGNFRQVLQLGLSEIGYCEVEVFCKIEAFGQFLGDPEDGF